MSYASHCYSQNYNPIFILIIHQGSATAFDTSVRKGLMVSTRLVRWPVLASLMATRVTMTDMWMQCTTWWLAYTATRQVLDPNPIFPACSCVLPV